MQKLLLLLLLFIVSSFGRSLYAIDKLTTDNHCPKNEIVLTINFRFNRAVVEPNYMNNMTALAQLDSLFTTHPLAHFESMAIVAFASPEGQFDYNQRLSEQRAENFKRYLLGKHPAVGDFSILVQPLSENWDGLRELVMNDLTIPMKTEIVALIDDHTISPDIRTQQLMELDHGRVYNNHLLPKYRNLRNASLFLTLVPKKEEPIELVEETAVAEVAPILAESVATLEVLTPVHLTYPVALKTNLLYDIIGGLNIGVELPFAKKWSVVADVAYSNWSTKNLAYAFRTSEVGLELRYWFGVSDKKKERNANWEKPLKGWNIGAYGRYIDRFGIRCKDGYQADGIQSYGITAGYSLPIANKLALDFSIGAGYIALDEYRSYEHVADRGSNYLIWTESGSLNRFSLTRASISLVWLIQRTKK